MSLKLVPRKDSENLYIRGTVHGQNIFESTGTSDPEIAALHLKKRVWELEKREIFGEEATITFAEAALAYMNKGGEKRFLADTIVRFGRRPLKDITQTLIDNEGADAYPDCKPSTLRRQWHGPIISVLNHVNWAHNIKKPKEGKPKIKWIEPEDAEKVKTNLAPHLKAVWPFFLGTGARASEAAKLSWVHVNLASAQVRLVDTKNGSSRLVDLPRLTVAALSTLPHRKGTVFLTNRGKPYEVKPNQGGLFIKGISRATERAGIIRCTPHDLRHTWATWRYAATKDILDLKRQGGWSDANTAERYSHEAPRGLDERLLAHKWDYNWHPKPENRKKTAKK